ncbi:uncharacterized protein N7484_001012 [Penicillium longicatenatum]|uniref:uncharacterized protein n=1 Tax=Penicillium longicatenatum TaxID=1561947 RepID=UPI0025472736|nr:uncharacterized protein N7484_001012 [Penicillium longicatenatum]KAJ5657363.1 hypothetical protein N7484_001012 [Penicillium longicatenatum]
MGPTTPRKISDFFNRPKFAKLNQHLTPEKIRSQPRQSSPPSPLTEPRSSFVDLTCEPDDGPGDQLKSSLSQSVDDAASNPTPAESFQSVPSTDEALPASINGGHQLSQRIIKGGKEVVISSDGEESDSDSSVFDPALIFAKPGEKPNPPKMLSAPRHVTTTTKKYKNNIDSLVHETVDDDEIEANFAKQKAAYNALRNDTRKVSGTSGNTGLHEDVLTSVLGENRDDDDDDDGGGMGARRLMDAVRRTDALNLDKVWRFLDQTQVAPAVVEFPRNLFAPGSQLTVLHDPEARESIFKSGILEFTASLQRLPDDFLMWLFCAMPLEPREELRQAYVRVLTITPKQPGAARIRSLIRPDHIDQLFKSLGAKPQALNISEPIVEDSYDPSISEPASKDRAILLSIFDLLRDAAQLFANDTRERAIQVLLRITLDTSLTADYLVRSELQSCIGALLQSVTVADAEETERRLCTTVYETFRDPEFQSRMLRHILPTTMWISRLRYRLAVAFLLRNPSPLVEPVQDVLDLQRLARSLVGDERFQVKAHKTKGDNYYGGLTANAILLDIAINTALYDLRYKQENTDEEFNRAIDALAVQIKRIFSSIEDTGASHLKRMLAKETLESVHYRMVYSVRSRPPPKKTVFEPYAKKTNGNIQSHFKSRVTMDPLDETLMPIRRHE